MTDNITPGLGNPDPSQQNGENTYQPHPGMQVIQNGLNFTSDQVLKADISPAAGAGRVMADQAAGMLMQDVESFSHGMMQIATAAISKVTAEIIATDGKKGEEALKQITETLGELPTFISSMAGAAQTMESSFDGTGGQDDIKPREPKERSKKPKEKRFFFGSGGRS